MLARTEIWQMLCSCLLCILYFGLHYCVRCHFFFTLLLRFGRIINNYLKSNLVLFFCSAPRHHQLLTAVQCEKPITVTSTFYLIFTLLSTTGTPITNVAVRNLLRAVFCYYNKPFPQPPLSVCAYYLQESSNFFFKQTKCSIDIYPLHRTGRTIASAALY